ncbi:MAG: cob(I)yrinic acid a,c-diamide adenosyltransferase [Thermodesulfobacteriota bacterium]
MKKSSRRGLIMVLTGPGKGKTTAALGAALRASGQGLRVVMLQFIKARRTGEMKAAALLPRVIIKTLGLGLIKGRPVSARDRRRAGQAWAEASRTAVAGDCDLLILDEICVALKYGLLDFGEVTVFLRSKPASLHIILTGRDCPEDLLALADTVTHLENVKHHLAAGIKAQPGIEY